MRIVVPALVMPVAHHARSEDQERDERQGNTQDLDRFSQSGSGQVQSRKVPYRLGNINLMWDVRKALPVSGQRGRQCRGAPAFGRKALRDNRIREARPAGKGRGCWPGSAMKLAGPLAVRSSAR